ncbi:hypothetical protein BRCON_0425 [Candidatus Sumerlaea chitinivorans]|uniref:Uncharacterized protein n=1 Tax=Sumerlaea chitinivorans TaxID=2250252 RepID=A0A2Z4Y399_SUMC1|nr:hypothetical protein BRCON_0425 [Candidatus Sumerlaea chitinivorans]
MQSQLFLWDKGEWQFCCTLSWLTSEAQLAYHITQAIKFSYHCVSSISKHTR